MNNIKFSHNYPKLWNQEEAKLLDVIKLIAQTLPEELIQYDTYYFDDKKIIRNYKLPDRGFLLQLIFIGNKAIPFCTIRRHTEKKEIYYKSKIGERFNIIIKKTKEKLK